MDSSVPQVMTNLLMIYFEEALSLVKLKSTDKPAM